MNVWGWAVYIIGGMTVVTELLDGGSARWAHIPRNMQAYVGVLVFVLALCWPLCAFALILIRIAGAFRHG